MTDPHKVTWFTPTRPVEGGTVNIRPATAAYVTANGTFPTECLSCGALVTDQTQHNLWHTAIADVWDWIDRVAGSSCDTARNILSGPLDHIDIPDRPPYPCPVCGRGYTRPVRNGQISCDSGHTFVYDGSWTPSRRPAR